MHEKRELKISLWDSFSQLAQTLAPIFVAGFPAVIKEGIQTLKHCKLTSMYKHPSP